MRPSGLASLGVTVLIVGAFVACGQPRDEVPSRSPEARYQGSKVQSDSRSEPDTERRDTAVEHNAVGPDRFPFFNYLTGHPAPALVAFNPTDYDPRQGKERRPSVASLRADLEALRPAFDGLILYSYDKDLTPRIFLEAKQLRYRAVLLGIYQFSDEELKGTAELVRKYSGDLALAVVIGNEGLNFNRYKAEDLTAAKTRFVELVGKDISVPLTTSEPWSQYGQEFVQEFGDFLAPNIHPAFDRVEANAKESAKWARGRAVALAEALRKPVLIKETGLPHAGEERFSPQAQREFWEEYTRQGPLFSIPGKAEAWVSFAAAFEAFDLAWKAEESGMEIEGAWGLLNSSREPYPAFSIWAQRSELERAVEAAHRFLAAEMDRFSSGTVVYDDYASGGAGFFPTNWSGDIGDLNLDGRCVDSVKVGQTCLKVSYRPQGKNGWASVMWAYPDRPGPNWGEVRGRDVTGATRLRGFIRGEHGGEVVELSIGGVNREPHYNRRNRHRDEFGPIGQRLTLTPRWQPFEIRIPERVVRRKPLRIIGGFTCAWSRENNANGCTIYLDEVRYDDIRPADNRLIRSYVPTPCRADDAIRNVAFLYDNCLALLAFLARDDLESRRRATILADSMSWAQTHDRTGKFRPHPWRNGMACGPLGDQASDTARLPGIYDPQRKQMIEDRYAVSWDTGNQAWAIIALVTAHNTLEVGQPTSDYRYLSAALNSAEWIEKNCRADDDLGGYTGGFEGWEKTANNSDGPKKLNWRSTEHCIDLYVGFWKLALALKRASERQPGRWEDRDDGRWIQRALHARKFVLKMWNADKGYFWTGVRDESGAINQDAVPLDVQTWSLLAMGHDPAFRQTMGWGGPPEVPVSLTWVEQTCREDAGDGRWGYRFSPQGKGIWPEGAGQVATCYRYLNRPSLAESILNQIRTFRDEKQEGSLQGGILAAFPRFAETGFVKDFGPDAEGKPVFDKWKYPARRHVGATAWFLLGSGRGGNPYWLSGVPEVNE